jgi:hypothetical protein
VDPKLLVQTLCSNRKKRREFWALDTPLKLPGSNGRIYYGILVESRMLINTWSGLPEVYKHLAGRFGDLNLVPLWGLEGGKNGVPV